MPSPEVEIKTGKTVIDISMKEADASASSSVGGLSSIFLFRPFLVVVLFLVLGGVAYAVAVAWVHMQVVWALVVSGVIWVVGILAALLLARSSAAQFGMVSGKDLVAVKRFVGIVDDLLDKLPAEEVTRFSRSPDFELYEKIMKKYGPKR